MSSEAKIRFPDTGVAEANRLAGSLSIAIKASADVEVERQKLSSETQDAGTILTVVLGAPSVIAIAKGIAVWLSKNSGPMIEIERADGTSVRIRHADENTAAAIEAALR